MSDSNMVGKVGWIGITVDDASGGCLVLAPRGLAGGRFCIIEDPSGATAALYQP